MLLILSPQALSDLIADSRPAPGPFTLTSRLTIPISFAVLPTLSAAICAANGVLFLDPLNPEPPDVPQHTAFPLLSVIVMIVLLNEECICAIPSATLFFCFFRFRHIMLSLVF